MKARVSLRIIRSRWSLRILLTPPAGVRLVIKAVGITVTFGMARLERRLAPWQASER